MYLFLVFFVCGACSPKVVNYLNPRARFETFETYHLVNAKIGNRELASETTHLLSVVESRIHHQMQERRGYLLSRANPDLIIRYELVSSTNVQVANNSGFYNLPTNSVQVIYESVILLELYHKKKLVWQGSYDMKQTNKEERNEKSINKAVDLIFTTYPYKALSGLPDSSLASTKKKK